MGFIGNTPTNQFVSLKRQTLSPDGRSGSYPLDHAVSSKNDILVYLNNVKIDSYTISGQNITFDSPVTSDESAYILYLGQGLSTQNIPEDTINGKTALTTLANDDELLVYDTSATTLKKITDANLFSGKIVQIVSDTKSGNDATMNTTSTSFVDTWQTVSITPSSTSSKIYIVATSQMTNTSSTAQVRPSIFRGSTNLGGGLQSALTLYYNTSSGAYVWVPVTLTYLDSPATTSEITYTVKMKVGSGTGYWGVNECSSVFTAMEILG